MVLNINSVIAKGEHKGKTVNDVLSIGKKEIFSLIKEGFSFDDNVLLMAGIKKNVRDVKVSNIFVEHEKDTKSYEKDTVSLSKILKEIRTIDNLDETIEAEIAASDDTNNEDYEEV